MSNAALCRAIYCSNVAPNVSSIEIDAILQSARKNNPAKKITGVLLFSNSRFIQILEGPRDQVDELLKAIRLDERHYGVEVFIRSRIKARSFPHWSMAYIGEHADIADIVGLTTFEDVIRNLQGDDAFLVKFIAGCQRQLSVS